VNKFLPQSSVFRCPVVSRGAPTDGLQVLRQLSPVAAHALRTNGPKSEGLSDVAPRRPHLQPSGG
jgi:hypothetical protein